MSEALNGIAGHVRPLEWASENNGATLKAEAYGFVYEVFLSTAQLFIYWQVSNLRVGQLLLSVTDATYHEKSQEYAESHHAAISAVASAHAEQEQKDCRLITIGVIRAAKLEEELAALHREIERRKAALPFPKISAGTANAIAYQLEVGKERHSCPISDKAIDEWLRDIAKQWVRDIAKQQSALDAP